jgi:7-carboxy-7-deazaguanine synthase
MTTETQNITTVLPVMEHFYTLQGEGFHQGKAAYFIRLGGCDVGCVWCDVKDSWEAGNHPLRKVEELISIVKEAVHSGTANSTATQQSEVSERDPSPIGGSRMGDIVVITGGEPLMHDLAYLTEQLHKAGFRTHIETSGSSPLSGSWDWITLSPKKFKAPLPEVVPHASELKIVVFNKSDFDWAEKYAAQVSTRCKLYLQPEWDKAPVITPMIIDYIKAHPQWQLSLQIHKYINVP